MSMLIDKKIDKNFLHSGFDFYKHDPMNIDVDHIYI